VTHHYETFGIEFDDTNLMGPNAIKLAEEVCRHLDLQPGMKVLDLACGTALSSLFLAKQYGVTVFATDLWISPTENYQRVVEAGLEDLVYPIYSEAHSLPYADEFFDAIVCFDAYQYFGSDERYLNDYLIKLLKPNGQIGLAIPGFSHEMSDEEIRQCGENCSGPDDLLGFHTSQWWQELWGRIRAVKDVETFELACSDDAWEDWIGSLNPIGQEDTDFFRNTDALITIGLIARRS